MGKATASALAAAGALSVADAARLLRIRGDAMQRAVPVGVGAMAAIIGLDFAQVSAIAAQAADDLSSQGAVCQAANDNGGGQVVISGTKAAVERAMELANKGGARYALILGDDEIAVGQYSLKDMHSGEQQRVTRGELFQRIGNKN